MAAPSKACASRQNGRPASIVVERRSLYDYHSYMTVSGAVGRLGGVRILVTGGSSGLGLAMAQALTGAGARVAVTSRSDDRARAAAARIGGGAIGVALDVRDAASVSAAVDAAETAIGALDVLVSNAGIGMLTINPRFLTHPEPFWTVTPDGFDAVVATKITGSFLVAREVVPRMLAAGRGRVVTVSMSEQTMVRRGFAPYGPSGAAVEAFARVMAADLADTPVRANILLPGGLTATGMVPEDERRPGMLDPAIMGPPVVWLADPRNPDVHDERITAREFDSFLRARAAAQP